MYIDLKIEPTKEQIEELKQAIEANLVEQLETNNVSKIISDVVRATVKQEVNQIIQTKDFRQKIWERTEKFVNNLINDKIESTGSEINEKDNDVNVYIGEVWK